MKSLQTQFSFCQPLMLCTASATTKACGVIESAVLTWILCLVILTLWKNKPNETRKSGSISFSFYGSQRGLGFHLYLEFLCPLSATTKGMQYWETGNAEIIKSKLSISMLFSCHSSLLNRQEKFCQGKNVI